MHQVRNLFQELPCRSDPVAETGTGVDREGQMRQVSELHHQLSGRRDLVVQACRGHVNPPPVLSRTMDPGLSSEGGWGDFDMKSW